MRRDNPVARRNLVSNGCDVDSYISWWAFRLDCDDNLAVCHQRPIGWADKMTLLFSSTESMPVDRFARLDDLGQDLLGRVIEKLPVQSRAQLEAVSKTWRDISIKAGWSHISYCSFAEDQLLAFLNWLCSHVAQRRPEAVQTIQLRGKGPGEDASLNASTLLCTAVVFYSCQYVARWRQISFCSYTKRQLVDSLDCFCFQEKSKL